MKDYIVKSKPLTEGELYSFIEYCHSYKNSSIEISTIFKMIKEFHDQVNSEIFIVFNNANEIRGFHICNLVLGKLQVHESIFENSLVLKMLIEAVIEQSGRRNFVSVEIHDNDFSNDIEFKKLSSKLIASNMNLSFVKTASSFLE